MKNCLVRSFLLVVVLAAHMVLHTAYAQSAATVVEVSGRVESKHQSGNWQPASANEELANGDEIQTWEGKTTLLLSDESMLKLNRNSYLKMREISQAASWHRTSGLTKAASPTLKSIYRLFSGEAWLRNNNRDVDIEVVTPTVTASLRGTELHIEVVSPEFVKITVLEGAVSARNNAGSVQAIAGELIIAPLGQAPSKQTLLTPQDSVQWTVRVPNMIEPEDPLLANTTSAEQQTVAALLTALSKQNIGAAETGLAELQSSNSPRAASLEGLIKLAAGNHAAARSAFQEALQINMQDAVAKRGLAVSALLLGDNAAALQAAQQAVDPANNPTVRAVDWLLLSYIQRASFDLPAAEQAAQQAISRDPTSVLALSSLSLLQFADDRIPEARRTIEQALTIAPRDSPSLSMLGFIQLSERDNEGAQQSFTRAIAADPANSEAYLGASLLAQRQGQPHQSQKLLATAIALEPQRSLFLSYWAKALHAERRFEKALTVLDSATRLDQQDPTPHYYRAIIERDLFRAGEAISSLEQAIDLNNQRAVYRSRLLLDQDMAARNVNLAGIYGALGMNLLATQKAVQSTLDDYRNFSAHLFLSSTLSAAGRTFPASSEVLVSGLYLPANANSLSTINDYTTFFEGPEVNTNLQLVAGSDNTYGANLIIGAVLPERDLAYSFSASHGQTEGWAGDNGAEQTSAGATVKWQANPKDSFRARLSLADGQQLEGAINRIDPTTIAFDQIVDNQDSIIDLGYRRELSNQSDLLVNLIHRRTEFDTSSSILSAGPVPEISLFFASEEHTQRTTTQLQGQYTLALNSHQLSSGAIYLDGEQRTDFTRTTSLIDQQGFFLIPDPDLQFSIDQDDAFFNQSSDTLREQKFFSLYLDDIWQINDSVKLHLGAYLEDFNNTTTQETELNPRLGVVWQPTANDTLRLTGFRYLLPQVQPRLHPTQVAGVFTTRNTEEGALVEEFNIVWERNWRGGIASINLFDLERQNRERRDPSLPAMVDHSSLRGVTIGVNQQLGNRWAIAGAIEISEIRDDLTLLQVQRDEANAAITLRYVSPRRISAGLSQVFRRIDFFDSPRATERISLTDLSAGYTFANRKGGIEITVSNLFDNEFDWITDAFSILTRNPAREIRAAVNWNF